MKIVTNTSSTPTVGNRLTIYCTVTTTVVNIKAIVQLGLNGNGARIRNWNNFMIGALSRTPKLEMNQRSHYIGITNTRHDGMIYQCEAIINTTTLISSFLLHVIGE